MFRKLIAIVAAAALPTAAAVMPFLHVHLDDHATDHHGAHEAHAHLSGHAAHHAATDRPAFEDDDHDRPLYLQTCVAVDAQTFSIGPALVPALDLPAPVESPAHRSVQIVHGLDPPHAPSLPARAPPASLS